MYGHTHAWPYPCVGHDAGTNLAFPSDCATCEAWPSTLNTTTTHINMGDDHDNMMNPSRQDHCCQNTVADGHNHYYLLWNIIMPSGLVGVPRPVGGEGEDHVLVLLPVTRRRIWHRNTRTHNLGDVLRQMAMRMCNHLHQTTTSPNRMSLMYAGHTLLPPTSR